MNKPVTIFVDSDKAVARLSAPLILGDTYAVTFSGLSTAEAAASPEIVVLGPRPGEIAARSGTEGVLAMTSRPCADAFLPPPPPPMPRPREFPQPPPPPNPPVNGPGHPHQSVRLHFYVLVEGLTLAQGDLVFLWAPFEYDAAGNPIVLKGDKGDKGDDGDKGDRGEPGRNGVYVAMDGLYAFHISQGGDHPEDGHLWIHAQDESTLYAKDAYGNYLLDGDGNRVPLYYIDGRGHLLYRFFYQDSTHTELDLGRVITREGLYALHVSDGSDGEPAGHLMLHGQNLAQIYATDANGDPILDGDGNPIPLFHLDANGHLIYTFYSEDGQVHATLDIGDVRGPALTWADLTEEQKAALKGEKGDDGDKGDQGDPLTWDDLTDEQKAALKGDKGDPGQDGLTESEIREIVTDTMGDADDKPVNGSKNWVTSGGLWSVEQAILAMIRSLAAKIAGMSGYVAGAYHYKGTVDTVEELPSDGNEQGDVWNVRKDETHEDGMNYAWTGEEWDALGVSVDLSGYLQTASLDTALQALSGDTTSWFYLDLYMVAQTAAGDARQALSDASDAASAAAAAQNTADSKPSSQDVSDAITAAISSIDVMGTALPSGVSGDDLGDWISGTNTFLGSLPSGSEILSQNNSGNIYKGSDPTNELSAPPKILGHSLQLANLLPYTSGTTLSPETAVYRSSLASDGTFPTITDTAITTANAYFQFELELTVPSTVPSTITGPSGWVWLDGHGLPDPADLNGGETIYISVRLDCTARTFLASVWRVA